MILKSILAAGTLLVAAAPAFAQGGSPYNTSGQQAGGPRAGLERRYGIVDEDAQAGPYAVYPRERSPYVVVPRERAIQGEFDEE
ncbi:hypothetical protein [Methylobacterium sp. JK268]